MGENNFKSKLENRKISPSKSSWNALEARLDAVSVSEKKSPKIWMSIAASFIGLAMITGVYFVNKEKEFNANQHIVKLDKRINLDSIKPMVNQPKIADNDAKAELKTKPILKKQKDAGKTIIAKAKLTNNITAKAENTDVKSPSLITDKTQTQIATVVEKIKELDQNASQLNIDSNDEVEQLLKQAQHEITFNKLYQEAMKTVDAQGLLDEVEGELLQRTVRKKMELFAVEKYEIIASRNQIENQSINY